MNKNLKFKIKNFVESEQFLALHIPRNSKQTFPGEAGLTRAKYFLHLLGDPQEKIKVIHVAGTSGKGSTCYLISSLLASQGFKVGLHQSPHLTDVTERFQINNQNISKKNFVDYLNKILPVIKMVGKTFHGQLTYFEILVGMAFLIFSEKEVDYAIMETGLGGRYDGTNVVMRKDKLSVLTKIGLDHTNILGKIIEEITLQKAMIINEKSQAISIDQDPRAEKVIREVAKNQEAELFFVSPMSFPPPIGVEGRLRLESRLQSPFKDVINRLDPLLQGDDNTKQIINNCGLIGDYQKENASLALAAINYLSQRDKFFVDKKIVNEVFKTADFPGRFDIKKINGKTVIFDGAHNPQKMEAFISSLIKKFPNKKFNFLLAFKKGKNYQEMLKIIVDPPSSRQRRDYGEASKIIITSFFTENQDMVNDSVGPEEIRKWFVGNAYIRSVRIIPNLKTAWQKILKEGEPIVVTGSLYLVGEIFRIIKTNK